MVIIAIIDIQKYNGRILIQLILILLTMQVDLIILKHIYSFIEELRRSYEYLIRQMVNRRFFNPKSRLVSTDTDTISS